MALVAKIGGVVAGVLLVFDFVTGTVGFVDLVRGWFRYPVVTVQTVAHVEGSECIEFAFSSLPRDFALGEIELTIVSRRGPTGAAGSMTAGWLSAS